MAIGSLVFVSAFGRRNLTCQRYVFLAEADQRHCRKACCLIDSAERRPNTAQTSPLRFTVRNQTSYPADRSDPGNVPASRSRQQAQTFGSTELSRRWPFNPQSPDSVSKNGSDLNFRSSASVQFSYHLIIAFLSKIIMNRPSNLHVVWYKRDLRICDHRPLADAAACGPVLPLFVVEPDYWKLLDVSARQWAFVAESLEVLRRDLAKLGQPLVVRTGNVVDLFARIHRRVGIAMLHSHQETGNAWTYDRDRAVARWCRENGVVWQESSQDGIVRGMRSRDGWAQRAGLLFDTPPAAAPRALAPLSGVDPGVIPSVHDLGFAADPCPERQRGGRDSAITTLSSFLAERGESYRRRMSSPVTAFSACSRVSPHLAWGNISVREVFATVQRYEKALPKDAATWRSSLSSFRSRLYWRSHFMQKLECEPALESRNLHPDYDSLRNVAPDRVRLNAWRAGETGIPFVDACMRALAATGWINFRMRAMLMSFASYHLWLDWRLPGEFLARRFTDYEPGIHWPQVQMQSGTTGTNTVRIYNPVKQGRDHDPSGHFIRRWVPELAVIPDRFIHEPWASPDAAICLDRTYPSPVVDYLEAARMARNKVWSIRSGCAFRRKADAIQEKHGSRKSGMAQVTKRARRPTGHDIRQLSLGFDTHEQD